MEVVHFNEGWVCKRLNSDERFRPVSIPHDAMIHESRSPRAGSGHNGSWFEAFDYEYVNHFRPSSDLIGKSIIAEFEGVYQQAEIWVRGRRIAFHPYGYTGFFVDLTTCLTFDEDNEIKVLVHNANQPNSRWYTGAGIYRPVNLWIGDKDHILPEGIGVRTLSIDPESGDATVQVEVDTTAPGEVEILLCPWPLHGISSGQVGEDAGSSNVCIRPSRSAQSDSNGSGVLQSKDVLERAKCHPAPDEFGRNRGEEGRSFRAKALVLIRLPQASLWNPGHPNLYQCRVRYRSESGCTDQAAATFGVRTIEVSDRGFLINGHRTVLQGACIHHDNGPLGACAYADAEERKIRLLREQGYNAIRSAHNPCSKAMLEVCDRLGVMVLDEYSDQWYIHKTRYDYADYVPKCWRTDLTDMAMRDRNHPSVIMYSIGNEVSETAQKPGIQLTAAMVKQLHRVDPTRPVTCGINIFFNFLNSIGLGQYSDKKAMKEVQNAPQKAKGKAVGSEFFNNMAGFFGADFMKLGATLPFCDWVTRGAFAALDIAGYNYGIDRYRHDMKKYPHRLILGSETFCSDAYRFHELSKTNPRLIGDFVWAGMDYLGETGVGAWEYEDYAPHNGGYGWMTAGSGRLDLTGRPLGEALYTRVALEYDQGPYIAVVPVNHTRDKHTPSAWKMSNAIDSWSWAGCEGAPATIEVYARAYEVVLLLNGKEIGRQTLKGTCSARFHCVYEPGILRVVSYDSQGRQLGTRYLSTASDETCLQAYVEYADGHLISSPADFRRLMNPESPVVRLKPGRLAFVRVGYADSQGIRKPLERGCFHASVAGGKLLAFGSAAPYNPGAFTTSRTETYFGEALAVIQASESWIERREGVTNILKGGEASERQAIILKVDDGSRDCELVIPLDVKLGSAGSD